MSGQQTFDGDVIATAVAMNVDAALAEDIGSGDVTAALIPADAAGHAEVICREDAILAGQPWFDRVFAALDHAVSVDWACRDGDAVSAGAVVCAIRGPARSIVTGERTALNFLQTLSATATATAAAVAALGAGRTRILDTRKTLPGLRIAQKYAVRCGGGGNHRSGLYDGVLIKENHIRAAGSIAAAVTAARAQARGLRVEVEVETMAELEQALAAGADMIMLDNFDDDAVADATRVVDGRALVEISGGVDSERLRRLQRLGADFVSVGALTKHVRAINFSMLMR